jgi:hypothetical protein
MSIVFIYLIQGVPAPEKQHLQGRAIRPRKVVASMQAALTAGLGQDRHSRAAQQPSKNTAARTAGALPGYRRDAAENNQPHQSIENI